MISWMLWRGLHHPPINHPIYQRTLTARPPHKRRERTVIFFGTLLILGTGCACAMLMRLSVYMIIGLLNTPSFLIISVCVAGVLLYGATLAMAACRTVMQTRVSRTYELLCLLPIGAWGATWALCTGSLMRRNTLIWFGFTLKLVIITLLIGLLFDVLLTGLLVREHVQAAEAFILAGSARVLAFGGAAYLGGVQAMVSAVLFGLLLPTWITDSAPVHILAAGLYLCVEIAICLTTALCAISVVPALFDGRTPLSYAAQVLLPAAVFVGLHEGLNTLLWRALRGIDASTRHEFMTQRAVGGYSLR